MKIKLLLSIIICFFMYSNGYSQWTVASTVSFGTTTGYPSVSVTDANTVWTCLGPNGTPLVLKSTNAGANFSAATGTGISLELYCIWGKDVNTAFVGNGGAAGGLGGNASFYRTTNGGATWTSVGSTGGTAGFINGIVFSKTMPSFGISQSDPPTGTGQAYYVSRTTDGGATWAVTNPPGVAGNASAQNSIVVLDNMWYGFGLNAAAGVYYTTNGGTTWVQGNLGIPGTFTSGFAMSDNKINGIAATNASLPFIARTTNGGTTWSSVNVGAGVTGYCTCKWIEGTNICYVSTFTGASGCIKKSTDAGVTWTTMTTAGTVGITHMEFYRSGNIIYGFAVAQNGTVLKLVDNITGIDPINNILPADYSLKQNYPNPFNPSTTIEFSIPVSGNVSLKVYDALGKEVASILDDYRAAGNYSEQFVGTGLNSGVYYYQLISGNFKETKKFMLVK
jgi:hypothetical protein